MPWSFAVSSELPNTSWDESQGLPQQPWDIFWKAIRFTPVSGAGWKICKTNLAKEHRAQLLFQHVSTIYTSGKAWLDRNVRSHGYFKCKVQSILKPAAKKLGSLPSLVPRFTGIATTLSPLVPKPHSSKYDCKKEPFLIIPTHPTIDMFPVPGW